MLSGVAGSGGGDSVFSIMTLIPKTPVTNSGFHRFCATLSELPIRSRRRNCAAVPRVVLAAPCKRLPLRPGWSFGRAGSREPKQGASVRFATAGPLPPIRSAQPPTVLGDIRPPRSKAAKSGLIIDATSPTTAIRHFAIPEQEHRQASAAGRSARYATRRPSRNAGTFARSGGSRPFRDIRAIMIEPRRVCRRLILVTRPWFQFPALHRSWPRLLRAGWSRSARGGSTHSFDDPAPCPFRGGDHVAPVPGHRGRTPHGPKG